MVNWLFLNVYKRRLEGSGMGTCSPESWPNSGLIAFTQIECCSPFYGLQDYTVIMIKDS